MTLKSQLSITNRSDEELMQLYISKGDKASYSELYNRYSKPLYKYFIWNTRNTEISADLRQNVLLKLYTDPQLFDPSRNFKVWLFSIAKNFWKNEMRNMAIANKNLEIASKSPYAQQTDDQSFVPDVLRLNKIYKKIDQLSDIHKEVIVLKYSSNLTITEISQFLECSEGTVKSRLFNAINNLKKKIHKER